jgi:flagellar basal body rod protein FlgG
MFLNSSLDGALDRIAERAADVHRAYTPGAVPRHDDVATPGPTSDVTLDPLAAVAPEGTYFVASDGRGGRVYTRDGAFAMRDGALVNAQGLPILGAHTPGAALTELHVDPVDAALDRVRGLAIDSDGSVAYTRQTIDPRSGARESQHVVLGRVALARFPAGTRLETADGSNESPPAGVAPQLGYARDGSFGPLATLRRERSRIDVDESLARLNEAYLAFDALQAAEAAKAHVGKTVMDLLK